MIFATVKTIYTLGYEGKTLEEFIKLLLDKGINHLVDVRSIPRSRREDFNDDKLKDTLFGKSIMYVHIPALGGMLEDDYPMAMDRESWRDAYHELKELAAKGPTAMMCLEKDPTRCHRRHIAERLEEDGWEVIHMGKGGSWKKRSLDDFSPDQV